MSILTITVILISQCEIIEMRIQSTIHWDAVEWFKGKINENEIKKIFWKHKKSLSNNKANSKVTKFIILFKKKNILMSNEILVYKNFKFL